MVKIAELEVGGRTLYLETGKLAKQADASVFIRYGDTALLVTAVSKPSSEKRDFLPLLVEYREQAYAAGKIPGGFFKREGKPREREILYGRAIDRALRPLFPEDMTDEIQIVVYLLSYDMENEANFLGIIGASAALHISNIPFEGPVAALRIGRIDGQYVINPTNSQMEKSEFDLLLAGHNDLVSMVEFGGKEIDEKTIIEAIEFAMPELNKLIEFQEMLRNEVGQEKREPGRLVVPDEVMAAVEAKARDNIREALNIPEKKTRNEALDNLREKIKEELAEEFPEMELEIEKAFSKIEKDEMRKLIKSGRRVDGRGYEDIRPITAEIGLLPRPHGSALFTRGETQALVVTTLGTAEDVQRLSELELEESKRFMLHYNFHPFSTGEVKPIRGPSRREIGHGALAEKALAPLIPPEEEFPYTIRLVSDIMESNGSTSMATVCGGSLSLMDAGVPIKTSCAGISIGLLKDGENYILLTDIIGAEDHFGDMDFKVAGTRQGVTAIQLDLKIHGLPIEVVARTLERAKKARHYILDIMDTIISEPRKELSQYAPKVGAIWIPREKIGDVIGPGGRVIRKILEVTGTKIDIDDTSGKVVISGETREAVEEAKKMIEELVQEVELGKVYMGKVVKIAPFGAFVEILPGKDGLVHISELAPKRVNKVEDIVKVGDKILVKVIDIDESGKIKLSRKKALEGGVKKVTKVD